MKRPLLPRAIIIAVLGLVLIALMGASPKSSNSLCTENGISSLSAESVDAVSAGVDFCSLENEELPKSISALILQLGSLHAELRQKFQETPQEFLPNGVDILLVGNKMGSLDSKGGLGTQGKLISFGVFSDWKGEPINEGVYARELGHVLLKAGGTPSVARKLSGGIFGEVFADFVAADLRGVRVSPSADLPECLGGLGSFDLTFHESLYQFDQDQGWRRLYQCCSELSPAALVSPHVESVCSNTKAEIFFHPLQSKHLDPFDPELALGFDRRFISEPLIGFLVRLSKQTGRSLESLFLDSLHQVGNEPDDIQLACGFNRTSDSKKLLNLTHPRFQKVIEVMRASLTATEAVVYDQLWTEFAMDQAMKLALLDAKAQSVKNASEQIDASVNYARRREMLRGRAWSAEAPENREPAGGNNDLFLRGLGDYYSDQHYCADSLNVRPELVKLGCEISCTVR